MIHCIHAAYGTVTLYESSSWPVGAQFEWELTVGRRLLVGVLDFSVTCSFRPYHGTGVDSAPRENEYQENFLGVKAASARGWQPHHINVPNVMKSGSLNLLEPSGPHRTGYGTPLPLPYINIPNISCRSCVSCLKVENI